MGPTIFIRLIGALWFMLVVYLTISAIGVKQETKGHLLQSFGLMFAIIAAFVLPHLPMFRFLNFAPVNLILSSVGIICALPAWFSSCGGGSISVETGARQSPSRKNTN